MFLIRRRNPAGVKSNFIKAAEDLRRKAHGTDTGKLMRNIHAPFFILLHPPSETRNVFFSFTELSKVDGGNVIKCMLR